MLNLTRDKSSADTESNQFYGNPPNDILSRDQIFPVDVTFLVLGCKTLMDPFRLSNPITYILLL